MGIKDKKVLDRISGKQEITRVPKICFEFQYVTKNKSYSFDFFKDKNDKCKAYEALFNRMNELSRITVTEAHNCGKNLGLEKIPKNQLSSQMQAICKNLDIISADSKLVIFRFCNNKYRLICKDDIMHPNLMHVIAFDFDHSAYDHG